MGWFGFEDRLCPSKPLAVAQGLHLHRGVVVVAIELRMGSYRYRCPGWTVAT